MDRKRLREELRGTVGIATRTALYDCQARLQRDRDFVAWAGLEAFWTAYTVALEVKAERYGRRSRRADEVQEVEDRVSKTKATLVLGEPWEGELRTSVVGAFLRALRMGLDLIDVTQNAAEAVQIATGKPIGGEFTRRLDVVTRDGEEPKVVGMKPGTCSIKHPLGYPHGRVIESMAGTITQTKFGPVRL